MSKQERCDQCEALRINGVYCHETGCPNAWKQAKGYCDNCGELLPPLTEDTSPSMYNFCSEGCYDEYWGDYYEPADSEGEEADETDN
jgi:hypothetical protein